MAKPSAKHAGNPALVSIGKTIRAIRISKGISQEVLAYEAGLDRSYIGGVERGEHNLSMMNLLKIAEELNIKISDLLRQANL